jgi:4-methylaminobutanoate oxidase (formaldehyde-forming)
LHDRLARKGACFGSKNGWERPNWFATPGVKPVVEYSFGRQNWFDCHAREHRACRESVAIFDQSGFSKFLFKGQDALNVLQRLCGADMDVRPGKAVYTGMFNARGAFESDITVIRLATDEFYLISGTSQTVRDIDWIRRNLKAGEQAVLTDVTEDHSVIGVMGPNSRALLAGLTDTDLSNQAFPFGTAQVVDIGMAIVRAIRITYVGELGWELHVPVSQAVLVYESLINAGKDLDVVDAGHYAINSLRLEKAYRAWGADISPDDTALEAGLGFAIGWKKSAPFLGKDALLEQKHAGLKRQLVAFVLQDPNPMLWGSEPIYRNGEAVGYTTSGSYGHALGAAVGMGYVKCPDRVTPEFIRDGRYEINVSGRRFPATPHLKAPYDPERKKILS